MMEGNRILTAVGRRLRIAALAGAVSLIALAVGAVPGQAASGKNTCPPPPPSGSTVQGGLDVTGQCTVVNVTINGGVTIESKGHLTLYGSTVNGQVKVMPGGEFDSNTPNLGKPNVLNGGVDADRAVDMDFSGGTIHGSVSFTGQTPFPGGFAIFSFCGVNLDGSLKIEDMLAASNGFALGDPGEFDLSPCTGNTISGSVQIRNNPKSRIEVETNHIGWSVQIWNSHPSVSANTIGGSLQCHKGATLGHWDADDTNTDTVQGHNTCA